MASNYLMRPMVSFRFYVLIKIVTTYNIITYNHFMKLFQAKPKKNLIFIILFNIYSVRTKRTKSFLDTAKNVPKRTTKKSLKCCPFVVNNSI